MPRYFFDVHDGVLHRDETGIDCVGLNDIRRQAKRNLPVMASDLLDKNKDHHLITVFVRDERNNAVYTATLTFNGLSLNEV